MIITRTPFRISLFGGGSDHPAWFNQNGGRVLSFAINKYCYLTSRILPPFFEHKFRIAYSKVETTNSIDEIQHPVVRESIRKFTPRSNLEIHHDGDLPARSGIGSSSAFAVGMIHSLIALRQESISRSTLADLAIEMEHEILKENVGWQDQIACALGGVNLIDFGPGHTWQSIPIRLQPDLESNLLSRMVLVFTGVSRNSSHVSEGLLMNLEKKSSLMLRVMDLAKECEIILRKSSDFDFIGEMLAESWALKKQINSSSSTSSLDEWYERGIRAGALGGKVLGAGGGGFMLYWVKEDEREVFCKKFGDATIVPFKICHSGSSVIYRDSSGGVE